MRLSRFFEGVELGAAIRDIVRGEEVRCAVAFWGRGAVEALFEDASTTSQARLICDISMGATNPHELKVLGAPENPLLRHLPGLHAKVYISDRGVVTTSANASNNGLGFLNGSQLTEAGTFHAPASKAFRQACNWFETVWARAFALDRIALEIAQTAWSARSRVLQSPLLHDSDDESLLDRVFADPEAFRGVGFVFTSGTSSAADRDDAAEAMIIEDESREKPILSGSVRRSMKRWPLGDVFSDWSKEEVSAWPARFVCAHRGERGGVSYWFYERSHSVVVGRNRGMVFGTQTSRLRRELGFPYGRQTMARADRPRLQSIYAVLEQTDGHRLFENGERLVRFLQEAEVFG